MPIAPADIVFKLSVTSGSAGNTIAGSPAGALGKYIATNQVTPATTNNLFPNISGYDNSVGITEYRCVFVHNTHGTITLSGPAAWIAAQVSGGADIAIAVDSTPASVIDSGSAQALEVADGLTAPAGLTFTSPTSQFSGLPLSDIPAGQCKAIWIRRTCLDVAALTGDGATITVGGETIA